MYIIVLKCLLYINTSSNVDLFDNVMQFIKYLVIFGLSIRKNRP